MPMRMNHEEFRPVATAAGATASGDYHALLLLQNHGNFRRSGEPVRFMYYEDGSWLTFPSDVFGWLKSGFVDGKPVVEVNFEGYKWFFDFYRMVQIDLENGYQRSIAWIDVDGKCFFPKKFVSSGGVDDDNRRPVVRIVNTEENFLNSENDRSIRIEIIISDDSSNLGKRKRENGELESQDAKECKAEANSSNAQRDRAKRLELVESGVVDQPRWPKVRLLKEGENTFLLVKRMFLSWLRIVEPFATVAAIHQCKRTGPMDVARVEVFKKQVEITKNARGHANVKFAWYVTSAKGVEVILKHGFGMTSANPGSQQSFGIGVYLSPAESSPQHSAMLSEIDDNGEKHVILCQVILGRYEKVEAASKQLHASSVDFDSAVDDIQNPRCYVVWGSNMNTHILPVCVVSYKSTTGPAVGQLNTSTMNQFPHSPNVLLATLYSKVVNSLSSAKAQELETLCRTYADGKLQRDTFKRQLRAVVGDEKLRSFLHEIRHWD